VTTCECFLGNFEPILLTTRETYLTSPGDNTPDSSYTENADFWVRIIRDRLDRYRSELTDQAVLEAIGPADRLTILDAGCGEGYLSRIFAQDGAKTIGVDACTDLVKSSQELAAETGLPINYYVGTVDNLPIPDGQCDIVACNHLINDLQDIATRSVSLRWRPGSAAV
jgi:2-polyprenyl-3-methyl-5-hydroxy-6-metoxy-1,4-benzoquinol methylase